MWGATGMGGSLCCRSAHRDPQVNHKMGFEQWDPKENHYHARDLMPIITPSVPALPHSHPAAPAAANLSTGPARTHRTSKWLTIFSAWAAAVLAPSTVRMAQANCCLWGAWVACGKQVLSNDEFHGVGVQTVEGVSWLASVGCTRMALIMARTVTKWLPPPHPSHSIRREQMECRGGLCGAGGAGGDGGRVATWSIAAQQF